MWCQGVDDLAVRLIAQEVAHTHSLRALVLDHNCIGRAGWRMLATALETNVSLSYFSCTNQHVPEKAQKHAAAAAEKHADAAFTQAKRAAFAYRQAVAVFVRGMDAALGPLAVRVVLEHLLGPGPQVRA